MGQIPKEYEAKDERMAKHLLKVQESLNRMEEWVIEKIPRGGPKEYDWADEIRETASIHMADY